MNGPLIDVSIHLAIFVLLLFNIHSIIHVAFQLALKHYPAAAAAANQGNRQIL